MNLDKNYQPNKIEPSIYRLWEETGAFQPTNKGKGYSLVVPPPNANGNLHIGHALGFALQDIAARYHRSKGESVLFVPGADHAGFETQVVYERELEKQGRSRFDFSRQELYQNIYDFVASNKDNFESQVRSLGASVDWQHYRFTLDQPVIDQAYSTFKLMWEQGLIYRGERLVNFCTFHGTAFADIEVDYLEDKGHLWEISYPLTDGSGVIVVATTRPETIFGDTAVAVNPNDQRYQSMVGKTVRLPLTNREIPIIEDAYVNPEFGSGAVKITPAHDPNDFEVAKRHDLPFVNVIGFDGKLTHSVPEGFKDLDVSTARNQVVKALDDLKLIVSSENYTHSVGHCYKCGTVIEPLLKEQWFIDIKPLAKRALEELKKGRITFYPKAKQGQLEIYLQNIKDWNISRQIVWGIPIPAFQNEDDPGDWIFDQRVDQEIITQNNKTYRRDTDVFDTWFSSSSWPYVTLGYPMSEDFKHFYPLSVMESGSDLLMPWISRMLMLGIYVTNEVPFSTIYLHGLVNDEKGQKMSKSKGNVVNPMGVIEEYGSDALRIGMITGQTAGNVQPYSPSKVVGGRNFCNKLWNIARFIEGKSANLVNQDRLEINTDVDNWIVDRYNLLLASSIGLMDDYRFSEAFEQIYHYIWDDFADWYIEASKNQANLALLNTLLQAILVLVHPFAPFITEAIWQNLAIKGKPRLSGEAIIELPKANQDKAQKFNSIKSLITAVRSINKAIEAKQPALRYVDEPLITQYADLIRKMANLSAVEITEQGRGVAIIEVDLNCWLDVPANLIDAYVSKLDSIITNQQTTLKRLKERLNNPGYLNSAPKEIVEESKNQLNATEQLLDESFQERLRFKS